ncbi:MULTISPECIES: IclR family transcriptional regulator domain-containing protein [unclassified Nocardioides]|uniref:IclR family transcriptional regulator domain-containing protein n=1 Tax=unclassified Nocardioides TaxID=2615069 RepID=UPI0006F21E0D|nr:MULTISPECIES: IclR family transcriptional regulator C-terminal domain-containing protein [unclassified Nocardioides]KQY56861.1 IclR family transcriptional regulator [Nocardioides sp. Root140]KQZ66943.1 IclR family transcriptional regulator [Nocardioides sp. Root151]KRF12983.1 IclR family transcriptional regulator [Nocardioides sp. Soil796]
MNQPDEAGTDRDFIQSIERGFTVLLAFDEDAPTPSATEIADRTGLSRPAVRRILLTLQRLGYVRGLGSRWTLTPRVLMIGAHFAATHDIVKVAQPHLQRLTELTHESSSLSQLDGTSAVCVGRVHVHRIMGLNVEIGTRLPLHATSMGRVLLAWADPSVVGEAVEGQRLEALTPHTVTDPVEFRDVLHDVRTKGYAVVDSELEIGFLSAAVPLRAPTGEVVAALAYSTSRVRHTAAEVESEAVPHLIEIAAAIESDYAAAGDVRNRLTSGRRDGFF